MCDIRGRAVRHTTGVCSRRRISRKALCHGHFLAVDKIAFRGDRAASSRSRSRDPRARNALASGANFISHTPSVAETLDFSASCSNRDAVLTIRVSTVPASPFMMARRAAWRRRPKRRRRQRRRRRRRRRSGKSSARRSKGTPLLIVGFDLASKTASHGPAYSRLAVSGNALAIEDAGSGRRRGRRRDGGSNFTFRLAGNEDKGWPVTHLASGGLFVAASILNHLADALEHFE